MSYLDADTDNEELAEELKDSDTDFEIEEDAETEDEGEELKD